MKMYYDGQEREVVRINVFCGGVLMATFLGAWIRKSKTKVIIIDTDLKEHTITYPGGVVIEELPEE